MKKILVIVLSLVGILFLTSCSKTYNYDYESMSKEVNKIEVIEIKDYGSQKYFNLLVDYDLLKEMEGEEKNEFLLELSKIDFKFSYGSPNTNPKNLCLKLYYDNGDIGFINYNNSLKFSSKNKRISSRRIMCPEENFDELISKYIDN